jgi:hypothetical protein
LNTDKNGIAIRVAHCGGGPNKAASIVSRPQCGLGPGPLGPKRNLAPAPN